MHVYDIYRTILLGTRQTQNSREARLDMLNMCEWFAFKLWNAHIYLRPATSRWSEKRTSPETTAPGRRQTAVVHWCRPAERSLLWASKCLWLIDRLGLHWQWTHCLVGSERKRKKDVWRMECIRKCIKYIFLAHGQLTKSQMWCLCVFSNYTISKIKFMPNRWMN